MSWSQRLNRVFGIDVQACIHRGGAARIVTSIEDSTAIRAHFQKHHALEEAHDPSACTAATSPARLPGEGARLGFWLTIRKAAKKKAAVCLCHRQRNRQRTRMRYPLSLAFGLFATGALAGPFDRDPSSVRQVAEFLKVTGRTIYRLAAAKQTPTFKVGGTWRFSRADIHQWIQHQQKNNKVDKA